MTDSGPSSLVTEAAVARVHHAAIGTRDVEASLVFWRDGLGFEVLMDHSFDGPWPDLFGGSATTLRSVFLGDPGAPDAGIVELVDLDGMAPRVAAGTVPTAGFFLLSLYADLDAVLPRLAALGLGGEPVVAPVGPVRLAVVHDPNGVRVELMDQVAEANMGSLTEVGE
jgi:catechol 2,3-dioxygenase-like lactoylglutathione lyase family enzyme